MLKKCVRTIDPETKRFSPVYDENETIEVKADKIVFAIGQAIEWGNLLEGTKVTFCTATIQSQTSSPIRPRIPISSSAAMFTQVRALLSTLLPPVTRQQRACTATPARTLP